MVVTIAIDLECIIVSGHDRS